MSEKRYLYVVSGHYNNITWIIAIYEAEEAAILHKEEATKWISYRRGTYLEEVSPFDPFFQLRQFICTNYSIGYSVSKVPFVAFPDQYIDLDYCFDDLAISHELAINYDVRNGLFDG